MPKHNLQHLVEQKFSTLIVERKASYLELFYGLVYVIVISETTHYLPQHPDMKGLLDYGYLFAKPLITVVTHLKKLLKLKG